jgi:putative nucleotidyltransferase with HDIG domain
MLRNGTTSQKYTMKLDTMTTQTIPADIDISNGLEERLVKSVGKLQVLSAVAKEALSAARDPNCTIQQFTSLVERDIKLASDLLAIANSAAFSAGRPVASLKQSVVRLGFRQCRNLILSSSLAALMKKLSLRDAWVQESLGRHAYMTATLATLINRLLKLGLQGEEFVAGLIHDIGRNMLAVLEPERFREIDPVSFSESDQTPVHELQVCGTDHCQVGAWFAGHNDLPPEFGDVIRLHHTPELATSHQSLIGLVAVSDDMANHLQRESGPGGYLLQCDQAVELLVQQGATTAPVLLQQAAEQMMTDALIAAEQAAVL